MPAILLVADDIWVRNDVAAAVSDPGTTLEVLDEPEQAAEALARDLYDVVIVDMQVKSMGGVAVTRLLRDAMATGAVGSTPIILLLDRSADTFLARRAGVDASVVKPFTAQDLRAAVASVEHQPA